MGQVDRAVSVTPVATGPEAMEEFVFPLSFAQERLWFLDQLQAGQAVYNMYSIAPWAGPICLATLEQAFGALVARHETLRTRFAVDNGGPVQVIASALLARVESTDLSALPPDQRAAAAERLAIAEAARPFDLRCAPLIRLHVVTLAPHEHTIVLTIHHIICDGWSMRVLHRELGSLYSAFAEGRPARLPPLPIQYADYVIWQREWLQGETLERLMAYWRSQLAAAPAVLNFPMARPRPVVQSYRGQVHNLTLDAKLSDDVRHFASASSATVFMVLLAAFNLLLARYTGQTDIIVGTPIANRTRVELEGLIGFFANTLVLRSHIDEARGFRDLIAAVRATTLSAYAHQDLPFEQLVQQLRPQRALNHNPLFQVMFVVNAFDPSDVQSASDDADYREVGIGTAKFDMHMSMIDVAGKLRGVIEYATDLFDAASIERFGRHFETLLRSALAAPYDPVGRLPLLDANETAAAAAAAASPWPLITEAPSLVHARVAEQAARTPDRVAVREGGRELLYGELETRAVRLAHKLVACGVGPEVPVGVYLGRSIEQVIAVLAILKAGGCYVPLDPSYPEQRLVDACADSGLRLVVAGALAPPFAVPAWVDVDSEDHPVACALPEPPREALAYILYTSGSTGRPKGVAMPHGPLANLVAWQNDVAPPPTRVLQFTSLNFDVSAQEIFSTLGAGATLVLASDDERRDPAALLRRLAGDRIERIFLPAPALQALVSTADAPDCPALALREIITAGEQLQVSAQLRRFVRRHCIAMLCNQYGPTETHVASQWRLPGPAEHWPDLPSIGRAIAGGRLYLLDRHGALVADGLIGEIHIGGLLPARGYHGNPEQTAAQFLPDPFALVAGARMYRTGDLAHRDADGTLYFHGRRDRQVKVRGVRVEPGEVEATLRDIPTVREVAVVDGPDPAGGKRLIAYVVPAAGSKSEWDAAALRQWCRARLPEPMTPALFVPLASMPLTPNGKIDRAALPAPEPTARQLDEPARPRTSLEAALADIWSEVLKVEPVGSRDNFFDLGGHSLLATRIVARIRARFGVELPLRMLFEAPTVADLAAAMLDQELAHAGALDAAEPLHEPT